MKWFKYSKISINLESNQNHILCSYLNNDVNEFSINCFKRIWYMLKLRSFLIIFCFAFVMSPTSHAQKVDLNFFAGNRIKTNMTEVTSIQMFTTDGIFALSQLKSASFWETFPDSASIFKMRKGGVAVYLRNERKAPIVERDTVQQFTSIASLGIGLGIDYGGIGAKLELFPSAPIGLFVGFGNNLEGTGYNAGLNFKLQPYKRNTFFVTTMYGYNTVTSSQTFYGFSLGLGGKVNLDKSNRGHLSIAAIYPIRAAGLQELIKQEIVKASPVLASIGISWSFGRMPH